MKKIGKALPHAQC
jgi:cyclin-dependent kinase 1